MEENKTNITLFQCNFGTFLTSEIETHVSGNHFIVNGKNMQLSSLLEVYLQNQSSNLEIKPLL